MLQSNREAENKVKPEHLTTDIFNYIVAGMEATSYVLGFGTYFLLNNPEVKAKLDQELIEARHFIQNFDHRKIMALPYLVCPGRCWQISNLLTRAL